jgi:hypothetical protein
MHHKSECLSSIHNLLLQLILQLLTAALGMSRVKMKLGDIIKIGIVAFFVTFFICYAIQDYTLFWLVMLPIILWFCIEETREHQRLVNKGIKKQMKDLAIKQHRKGELTSEDRAFLRREYGEGFLKQVSDSVSERQRQQKIFDDEFLEIRTEVLKRDNYRCVNCGMTGKELHVHHVVSRSEGGTNDLSNLVTLCSDCHSKQDAKGHFLIQANNQEDEIEEDTAFGMPIDMLEEE